jgi:hypothetical protein
MGAAIAQSSTQSSSHADALMALTLSMMQQQQQQQNQRQPSSLSSSSFLTPAQQSTGAKKVQALKNREWSSSSRSKGYGDLVEGNVYEVVTWELRFSTPNNCYVHLIRPFSLTASTTTSNGDAFLALGKHLKVIDDDPSVSEASNSQ